MKIKKDTKDSMLLFFSAIPLFYVILSIVYNFYFFSAFGLEYLELLTLSDYIGIWWILPVSISTLINVIWYGAIFFVTKKGFKKNASNFKKYRLLIVIMAVVLLSIYSAAVYYYYYTVFVFLKHAAIIHLFGIALVFLGTCVVLFPDKIKLSLLVQILIIFIPHIITRVYFMGYATGAFSNLCPELQTEIHLKGKETKNSSIVLHLTKGVLAKDCRNSNNYFITWDNINYIEYKKNKNQFKNDFVKGSLF